MLAFYLMSFCYGQNVSFTESTVLATVDNSSVYTYQEIDRHAPNPFSWISVVVKAKDNDAHVRLLSAQLPTPGKVNSTFFVQQPVYISLTTMASRMHKVNRTIISLIQARVVPTKIFLFISKDKHLLDAGVKHIPDNLLCLAAAGYLRIVYTNNIGPHRKLLPALKRYWGKDVFIATVDDDMSREQGYMILYQLLKHFITAENPNSIVALRARRISICNSPPHKTMRYHTWPVVLAYNRGEMLLMPTGTGGILYKPTYFDKVIFHRALRTATGTADDLMFRLATLITHTPVQLGCSILRYREHIIRRCKRDDFDRKYDKLHGTGSTNYFHTLMSETTQVAEAQRAQKALALLEREKEEEDENEDEVGAAFVEQVDTENENARHSRQLLSDGREKHSPSTVFEASESVNCGGDLSEFWHEARRLVTHKIKYRGVPNAGAEKDLFAINKRGGNDQAWKLALDVLRLMHLIDFEQFAAEYWDERERQCYEPNRSVKLERICALFDCQKGRNKTVVPVAKLLWEKVNNATSVVPESGPKGARW